MAKKVGSKNSDEEMLDCMTCIRTAFQKYDIKNMREISKHCQKNIVIDEQLFFYMSLLSYTLSKLLQKSRYRAPKLYQKIIIRLNEGVEFAKKSDEIFLLRTIDDMLKIITDFDARDRRYVINLIEKGRTKIAASLYAQGLSLSRVISITGAQKQEVLNYSGKTVMSDRVGKTIGAKERLKNAKEIIE